MDKKASLQIEPASFRDPSGFIFKYKNNLYRQINQSYKDNFEFFINSGLYNKLIEKNLIIPHKETTFKKISKNGYKIIQPEKIEFISYPYEWSFSQLKDAALTILEIEKIALQFGMSLKDASAYNIQFKDGKPILIDTLSFEQYQKGKPWIAYKQFCQHFLSPLALAVYKDIKLIHLLKLFIDGIPLSLTSKLLPLSTHFKLPLLFHIHAHAKSQEYFSNKKINTKLKHREIPISSFFGLIDSLESAVKNLKLKKKKTEWSDYYNITNYTQTAFNHKRKIISDFMSEIRPKNVWDVGANIGIFSQIPADKNIFTLSIDSDAMAVEKNYLTCKKENKKNILPLVIDITNPSPSIGWNNTERPSLIKRGPADMIMALALVHHLAISNNLPFDKIAEFFSNLCEYLIIEFIPKNDSQVQKLLQNREDIFNNYTQPDFEKSFKKFFKIMQTTKIKESERIIYLMRRKK